MKQTVVVDFDGVIHSYTSGWKGATCIPDAPVEGTAEAIAKLRTEYRVVVVSSRCSEEAGIAAVTEWLAKHSIVVDEVCAHKPPHIVVIDDRAIRFEGDWQPVLNAVPAASIPWNKKRSVS